MVEGYATINWATDRSKSQGFVTWGEASSGLCNAIYRDGIHLTSVPGSTTTYSDRGLTPETAYSYELETLDRAGNASPRSGPTVASTGPPNLVLSFVPTDDATVEAANPDLNLGNSTKLTVDSSPSNKFLLKFAVSDTGGCQILSARLRLRNVEGSTAGGAVHRLADTTWDQATVTWNNAPAPDLTATATFGPVASNTDYEADITPLVTGDGTLALMVLPKSSDGASYSSKEGSRPPQLLVECAST